jgi:hypothetical protein
LPSIDGRNSTSLIQIKDSMWHCASWNPMLHHFAAMQYIIRSENLQKPTDLCCDNVIETVV